MTDRRRWWERHISRMLSLLLLLSHHLLASLLVLHQRASKCVFKHLPRVFFSISVGVGVGAPEWVTAVRFRGPQKDPNKYTARRGMKGRREEGEMMGGWLQSSECQVLMCLFSITAVPGSDREGKQTATLMYYTQTRNSGLVAISLRWNVSPPSFFTSNLHALVFVETEELSVAHLFSYRRNKTTCTECRLVFVIA